MMRPLIYQSWTFLYFIISDVSWSCIDAQTYDNMTTLKKNLLSGYDKDVKPVINQSNGLNVTVMFSLFNIPEVDTVNYFLKLRAFLYLAWTDEKLTWIPADYGDIQELSLPVDKVWIPPLFLGNAVVLDTMVKSWQKVYINYNGVSQVALGGTFNCICEFNMTYWPFDKHACNLYFVPLSSGTEKIKFVFPSNPIHDNNFLQMGEWTYDQMLASYQDQFDSSGKDIIYTIKIRRQSAFYVLTLILPLYFVSFLGLLVFLIPCNSGERVGFAVTIMLSMVVFMLVIKEQIPKSSDPLPYMCIYINASVCVAFLVNIINLFSLNLFHKSKAQPVGQKYKYLVHFIGRKPVQPDDAENNNKDENSAYLSSTSEKNSNDLLPTTKKENVEPNCQDFISEQYSKHEIIVTWKDVSNAIDKLTLIVVLPITLLVKIIGTLYLYAASDYPNWAN